MRWSVCEDGGVGWWSINEWGGGIQLTNTKKSQTAEPDVDEDVSPLIQEASSVLLMIPVGWEVKPLQEAKTCSLAYDTALRNRNRCETKRLFSKTELYLQNVAYMLVSDHFTELKVSSLSDRIYSCTGLILRNLGGSYFMHISPKSQPETLRSGQEFGTIFPPCISCLLSIISYWELRGMPPFLCLHNMVSQKRAWPRLMGIAVFRCQTDGQKTIALKTISSTSKLF